MAACALLEQHPDPTDEEIKEGMLGNLCRCTGYYKIIESIKMAAAEMRTAGEAGQGHPAAGAITQAMEGRA
jgi:carbon-monoxide dehydrogenase small subunit